MPPNAFDLRRRFGVEQKQPSYWKWRSAGDGSLKKPRAEYLKTKSSAELLARRPFKVVAIALANKMARIAWALLASGGIYRAPALAAS
jgi:hypothetical protein